jgi:hypothetical protein
MIITVRTKDEWVMRVVRYEMLSIFGLTMIIWAVRKANKGVTSVTGVLQGCHESIIRTSQGCYKCVSRLLGSRQVVQECHKGAPQVLQGCHETLPGFYKGIERV